MKGYVLCKAGNCFEPPLARVSSVFVGLGKTERPGFSVFLTARKMGSRPIFRSGEKNPENPDFWSFFASQPHGNAFYTG